MQQYNEVNRAVKAMRNAAYVLRLAAMNADDAENRNSYQTQEQELEEAIDALSVDVWMQECPRCGELGYKVPLMDLLDAGGVMECDCGHMVRPLL